MKKLFGLFIFFLIAGKCLADNPLSDAVIGDGLMEALRVGIGNTVTSVSMEDGYLGNELIRIPMPDSIQKVETLIRAAGYGETLDNFVQSMNRAAEKAAPEAKVMFLDAIGQITLPDARNILQGRDNEATLYFRGKTEDKLATLFQPIIQKSLADVGVTRYYQDLEKTIQTLPVQGLGDVNLEQYVTNKALDGLFTVLAQEEKKIRENPEAQVSDLLKNVFGH
ncbi:DUF4197 domain-containing protein [bacterium]|nr:DUF4197 domain-containing protein [candidate division CSSED10-310 bacterium]